MTALQTQPQSNAQTEPSWHSPSLTMETVTGPNGEVTTRTALGANALWGLTETKVAEKVVDGVYALRCWAIASSYALEAAERPGLAGSTGNPRVRRGSWSRRSHGWG